MARKHDEIAKRIAKARGGEYDPTRTPDVKTPTQAVEVEVKESTLSDGIKQLRSYRGPKSKYLGVPRELADKARERTQGTGIGVMLPNGRIIKRARRHTTK